MKKSHRKFINRIINKLYAITKSKKVRLTCLNIATKVFKNSKNSISFDRENNLYWLKNESKFLISTEIPYFDFSKNDLREIYHDIFCAYYTPKLNDVVVDIGAGIGTEIWFFKEQIGMEGKLFSVEASPSSFRRLEQTVLKNGFNNCFNFNLAISDNNESIWMEEQDNYVVNSINKVGKGVEVKAMTLNEFVLVNKIAKINLLKVNIEGAEYEMINGMKNVIGIIDNVAISCHDFLFDDGQKITEGVTKFLKENNFQIFNKNTDNKVLDSWIYGRKKTFE